MEYQQFTGKDINDAISNVCNTLGVMSSDIEYKILSEGKQNFFSKEPAIVEVRKKQLNILNIKNIEDENLSDGDIVKQCCEKCNKNVFMKIMITPNGVVGICSKCKNFITLKKNENYISEISIQNIPKCPICQSTNLKKITLTKRAVKTAVFGVIGAVDDAGKTWKCNNCGSKF